MVKVEEMHMSYIVDVGPALEFYNLITWMSLFKAYTDDNLLLLWLSSRIAVARKTIRCCLCTGTATERLTKYSCHTLVFYESTVCHDSCG